MHVYNKADLTLNHAMILISSFHSSWLLPNYIEVLKDHT